MNKYIPIKKELYTSIAVFVVGILILALSLTAVLKKIYSVDAELFKAERATISVEESFFIKKDLSDLQKEISMLDSFFINPGEEVDFIEKLETIGKSSGVKTEIRSIVIGKKATSTDITENLNIKVSFEGEWDSMALFLKSVESMPYAVSLGNVNLNLVSGPLWRGEAEIAVLKIKDI